MNKRQVASTDTGGLPRPQDSAVLSAEAVYRSVLREYPDVLSVPQVSTVLGVSTKTVYRLLNDGALASLKVGREFKVPKVFVLQYIKVLGKED